LFYQARFSSFGKKQNEKKTRLETMHECSLRHKNQASFLPMVAHKDMNFVLAIACEAKSWRVLVEAEADVFSEKKQRSLHSTRRKQGII
jgi:hypothetical protein